MKLEDKRINKEGERASELNNETIKSVIAILLIGAAVILVLASLDRAGPIGRFIYLIFKSLFGLGFFLLPLMAFVVALILIIPREQKFYGFTFIGAALATIFALGLIEILIPNRGGILGRFVGFLQIPFGYPASIVLLTALFAASILIMLNAGIKFFRLSSRSEQEEKLMVKLPDGQKEISVEEIEKIESSKKSEREEKKSEAEPVVKKSTASAISKNYVFPPLSLLKSSIEKPTVGDLRANANIIKRTFESFNIPVEMGEINIGPKVTRYTLKPAEGIKLSRVTALSQDLSLALAAHPIRIEAPIPGKSFVGIEVPNKAAAMVRLGSLIKDSEFAGSAPLVFILGRDVNGNQIYANIAKMPHMLIAGATGSGKSILIHTILLAILYKNSPEIVKMLLIDPKRVELSVYDDIPHLIAPVITEGKKAVAVFRWAIQEMERRYEILLQAGSRDIESYNKSSSPPLPYILIVIDELADLMAAYGREIEASIIRLAQMARATGLHLIVSTQRPSVEVITGLIKANITSRVALQVASQIDSRTILDAAGAEKLLGAGDMLFVSTEFSKPRRIQGAYVSEEEINDATDFIRKENKSTPETPKSSARPESNEAATNLENLKAGIPDEYLPSDDDDELFDEAIKVVIEAKKASASLLQRRLKIGYARAARLLDIMEAKDLIGPGEGAKPREVYLDKINRES